MRRFFEFELANRSGAKGSAKAKKCVTCDGKGWKHVYSQVICFSTPMPGSRFLTNHHTRSLLSASQLHEDHVAIVMARARSCARRTGKFGH
jgi:hypothetical protein